MSKFNILAQLKTCILNGIVQISKQKKGDFEKMKGISSLSNGIVQYIKECKQKTCNFREILS
jgi:hypothetical protein